VDIFIVVSLAFFFEAQLLIRVYLLTLEHLYHTHLRPVETWLARTAWYTISAKGESDFCMTALGKILLVLYRLSLSTGGLSTIPWNCPLLFHEERTSTIHICRASDGSGRWVCPKEFTKLLMPPFCVATNKFTCPPYFREEGTYNPSTRLCRSMNNSIDWTCPRGYAKFQDLPHCREENNGTAVKLRIPPCSGVSPLGMRWQYIMPEHTGTGSVVRFLDEHGFFSQGCVHHHGHRSLIHAQTYAAFTFLSSPYKRVLSDAAYYGIIDVSHPDAASDVPKFRAWLSAHGWPPVKPISELMGSSGVMDLYGRLEHLNDDLRAILRRLGYTKLPLDHPKFHCISRCGAAAGKGLPTNVGGGASFLMAAGASETGKMTENRLISDISWFDDASTKLVLKWYAEDFVQYNFSTDPNRAWSSSSRRPDHDDIFVKSFANSTASSAG
jgi:hypothetical protein